MSISYSDLKPAKAIFRIGLNEYTLRAFDLTAQVWASDYWKSESENNGLVVLSKRLEQIEDVEAITKTCWYLLENKHLFENKYTEFLNVIEKGDAENGNKWLLIADLFRALSQTLGVSQPDLEEFQEDLELKKSKAVEG